VTTKIPFSNTERARELFGASGDIKRFDLTPLGLPFSEHADGFKHAADLLVENLRRERNSLVYPVCYLYRHCLELWLKHLIAMLGVYLEQDFFGEKLGTHDLAKLWDVCRSGLEEVMPSLSKENLSEVEECINALASFDKDGEIFRYPVNKRLERWPLPVRSIGLNKMSKTVSTVVERLESYSLEINHRLDTRDWGRP